MAEDSSNGNGRSRAGQARLIIDILVAILMAASSWTLLEVVELKVKATSVEANCFTNRDGDALKSTLKTDLKDLENQLHALERRVAEHHNGSVPPWVDKQLADVRGDIKEIEARLQSLERRPGAR